MPLPRLIELSSVSPYGFKILGDISSDFAGGVVSPAGDINGDGYADILFTARGNDSGGSNAGAYYVLFGKAGGFGTIGGGSAIQFATLQGAPIVSASDFTVI